MVVSGVRVKRIRTLWRRLRGTSGAAQRPSAEQRRATVVASPEDHAIVARVRGLTMTHPVRVHALLDAVEYVVRRRVPGAFAECGVWRGGSVMAMLLKLRQLGDASRSVYLYDTFEGMTEPSAHDTSAFESPAQETWRQARAEGGRGWDALFDPATFNESAVRDALRGTGYPESLLHLVRGPVEQTIPARIPDQIALLRLDTDWYESTRHELEHLYPRLVSGGVLIIDDYGHWDGCRRAVDEYFGRDPAAAPLLQRIDYTARLAIKP